MNEIILAIKFGDNDFSGTFLPLLKVFRDYPQEYLYKNKETTLKVINELSYSMYRAVQNPYAYNDHIKDENTKKYLQIDSEDLLFGQEEVDRFTSNNEWDNGEVFILDTRIPGSQSIYSI